MFNVLVWSKRANMWMLVGWDMTYGQAIRLVRTAYPYNTWKLTGTRS